jgi:hypothetical protein
LGYYIPDYFLNDGGIKGAKDFERALQRLKCKYFCFLNPNPRKSGPAWTGRLFCNILYLADRLHSKEKGATSG